MLGQVSASVEEVERPLLTPDECARLPGPKKDAFGNITEAGDMLIFVTGFAPIYGKQILYFANPVFAQRARIAAPVACARRNASPGSPIASLSTESDTQESTLPGCDDFAMSEEQSEGLSLYLQAHETGEEHADAGSQRQP